MREDNLLVFDGTGPDLVAILFVPHGLSESRHANDTVGTQPSLVADIEGFTLWDYSYSEKASSRVTSG